MQPSLDYIILLCVIAFAAGFVDSIAGGGGLIQTPGALIILTGYPVSSVIASLKIPSLSGTCMAARTYFKKVSIEWKFMMPACILAFFSSFAGSEVLTIVSNQFMKPVLLFVLALVGIYTYSKKDFGVKAGKQVNVQQKWWSVILISIFIGFYDGFIGPGTGSFFIISMVSFLGYDFLKAAAHSKLLNISTNLGSITLFLLKGKIIWLITIPMSVSNAAGGMIGARLAIWKGSRFIRILFMIVILLTLLRYMYDIFVKS